MSLTPKKVLVTGFEGFKSSPQNPSADHIVSAVKGAYGDRVETMVLPVAHDEASQQLTEAIDQLSPDAVLMFGVAPGKQVRLETQARNWRNSLVMADNNNVRKLGRLDPAGPNYLESTLPLGDIKTALAQEGVPARLSRGAGQFLCNEVMYRALQHVGLESPEAPPTGFIHIGARMPHAMMHTAGVVAVGAMLDRLQHTESEN
jgi:pyroglutamyl-peptidase